MGVAASRSAMPGHADRRRRRRSSPASRRYSIDREVRAGRLGCSRSSPTGAQPCALVKSPRRPGRRRSPSARSRRRRTAAALRRGREEEVPQGLEAGALEHHRRGGPGRHPRLPGAIGPQGPVGPAYTVRDANGAVVGQFLGVLLQGFPIYRSCATAAVHLPGVRGGVQDRHALPDWKTNDCSGTAYASPISALGPGSGPRLFGGPYRFVVRTLSGGTFGPRRRGSPSARRRRFPPRSSIAATARPACARSTAARTPGSSCRSTRCLRRPTSSGR